MDTPLNWERSKVQDNLKLLREPFKPNQISKLPKPTKAQTDAVKQDFKNGVRCAVCGGWHHPNVIHLDYVGHAALTDRLLDADSSWIWEPMSTTEQGLPLLDSIGGLWIKLTVCGVTRPGYGCADGKQGGDAIKEVIGDALRNAAMRFGCALDLWHKGDLHVDDEPEPATKKPAAKKVVYSDLYQTMADTNDLNTVQFWRSLTQEKQQEEWKTIDKDAQKHLKAIMKEYPSQEQIQRTETKCQN